MSLPRFTQADLDAAVAERNQLRAVVHKARTERKQAATRAGSERTPELRRAERTLKVAQAGFRAANARVTFVALAIHAQEDS